ncbi:hypothetical protein MMC10_010751 [Thelotrema lepadinum]|nr:hypothetical protein [Thelotrema lepadinum]
MAHLVRSALRNHQTSLDHTPSPHPASPSQNLPDSFAAYRQKSQQHGPLGNNGSSNSQSRSSSSSAPTHLSMAGQSQIAYGHIGGKTGRELGNVAAPQGVAFDRSELPERFRRMGWTQGEIDEVESGGASLW